MKNALLKKQNHEKDQKRVFRLFHDFALRICIRYSGVEDNPEELMYRGFARLFKEWHHLKFSDADLLKKQLRFFLISVCIDAGMRNSDFDDGFWDCSSLDEETFLPINSHTLSNKDIIDILRTIPFAFRVIYNMSVIDRFSEKEISSKLGISEYTLQCGLRLARKSLSELLAKSLLKRQTILIVWLSENTRLVEFKIFPVFESLVQLFFIYRRKRIYQCRSLIVSSHLLQLHIYYLNVARLKK